MTTDSVRESREALKELLFVHRDWSAEEGYAALDGFEAAIRAEVEQRYEALVEAWRAYRPLAWRNSKAAREARTHFFACMDRVATAGAPQEGLRGLVRAIAGDQTRTTAFSA